MGLSECFLPHFLWVNNQWVTSAALRLVFARSRMHAPLPLTQIIVVPLCLNEQGDNSTIRSNDNVLQTPFSVNTKEYDRLLFIKEVQEIHYFVNRLFGFYN